MMSPTRFEIQLYSRTWGIKREKTECDLYPRFLYPHARIQKLGYFASPQYFPPEIITPRQGVGGFFTKWEKSNISLPKTSDTTLEPIPLLSLKWGRIGSDLKNYSSNRDWGQRAEGVPRRFLILLKKPRPRYLSRGVLSIASLLWAILLRDSRFPSPQICSTFYNEW
jgi:hypothetical protein